MIHIKRQNNSLNLQSDTEYVCLDDGITSILNKLQWQFYFIFWLSDFMSIYLSLLLVTHFVSL